MAEDRQWTTQELDEAHRLSALQRITGDPTIRRAAASGELRSFKPGERWVYSTLRWYFEYRDACVVRVDAEPEGESAAVSWARERLERDGANQEVSM